MSAVVVFVVVIVCCCCCRCCFFLLLFFSPLTHTPTQTLSLSLSHILSDSLTHSLCLSLSLSLTKERATLPHLIERVITSLNHNEDESAISERVLEFEFGDVLPCDVRYCVELCCGALCDHVL